MGDELALGYRLSRWRQRKHRHRPPGVRSFWIQEPILPPFAYYDVVHGTDGRVPNWHRAARVATVHDVGPLLFEDFSSPRFREKVRRGLTRLATQCHIIITDSESARADFLNLFDFPPERVQVVHLGVDDSYASHGNKDSAEVSARYGLDGNYLLYVGEISRRKNSGNLIEGYALSRICREWPLAIAGPLSYGGEQLLSAMSRLGVDDWVHRLGYVPEIDLPALYSGAAAFLFPTRYEGFGMPLLEAMACGVPVIGGNRGSVPEIVRDHAVLVDPDDPHSIAAGIDIALAMPPDAREAARRHALAFTWQACADRTRAVYERALALR